jgi:hypothetical protein
MLALIERTVRGHGGSYAVMDTDSIAIVATPTGGLVDCDTADSATVTALSHEQTRELLRRFSTLNPYGPDVINDARLLGRSAWKVEHDSLHRQVWCYAISSKRYVLYQQTDQGPELVWVGDAQEVSSADAEAAPTEDIDPLVDWSEHGLGLYLDPTDEQRRDQKGRRLWIREAWEWILTRALTGETVLEPAWFHRYAVS